MDDLNKKIYDNIVDQLTLKIKNERLQQEMLSNERRGNIIIGRMSVLAEIYQEKNGRSLDQDLNKSDEWSELINKAQAQAEKNAVDNAITNAQLGTSKNAPPSQRSVKAVVNNKQPTSVPQPVQMQVDQRLQNEADEMPSVTKIVVADGVQDAPKAQERTPLSNRKEPIKFTIDDAPPTPPPGAPVTELDDD